MQAPGVKVQSRGIVSVKGKGPLELFYLADGAAAAERCLATVSSLTSGGPRTAHGRRGESENGQLVRPRTVRTDPGDFVVRCVAVVQPALAPPTRA